MTYMDRKFGLHVATQDNGSDAGKATREPLVLVIEDETSMSSAFRSVCDCLNVTVVRMPTHDDLA